MRLSRLSALLFCSGAAALILEVAWFRRMAQLAGATSVALASVLAAVIGGMALGAFVLGRRAEHTSNPLRFYGACELAVAVLAFASPTLLVWAAPAFVGIGILPRFLLASLLLMPAAFFMGGTLPAMAAALRTRDDELGRGLGWLYAWNTFGAVTGTLLAGFFLLGAFGLQNTIRIASVLSGLAGGIAFACKPTAPSPPTDAQETPFSRTDRRRAAALFAASGFLGMACEAAFVRGLVLVFGSTTYAFTTMLAVFLFGIAAGGAIGTRFAQRARVIQRLETTIAVTAALFALGAVGIYFLPLLYLHLYAWLGGGFGIGITIRFALAALVLLPGAIGLGVAFPLAVRVASEGQAAAGTGRLYAANTLASVAGSTCAVFFLVPFFGPMGTVAATALCTALLVVVGLRRRMTLLTLFGVAWFLTLAVAKTSLGPQAVVAVIALFTACTVAILRRRYWLFAPALIAVAGLLPGAAIAREHFYAGVFYQPRGYLKDGAVDPEVWAAGRDVPFVKYGREATVSVLSWYGKSSLLIDGKAVATEQTITDVHHLELLGHLPVALHKNPQRVLVVGLGMGTTYRACWVHQPKQLTVVEIEEAVAAGAKRIGVRPEVPRDLIIDDARAHLRATDDLYDIITSDPIHPWVRGSNSAGRGWRPVGSRASGCRFIRWGCRT